MDDDNLKKYIPAYGDRLAVTAFCRKSQHTESEENQRKSNILCRLRNKLTNKKRKNEPEEELPVEGRRAKLIGNQNAKKDIRRIELGWMDYEYASHSYKQVRGINGGGTRHLKIDLSFKISEVLTTAKELFFPGGKSKKGNIDNFTCTIIGYNGTEIKNIYEITLREVYEQTKLKMLRVYLGTKSTTNANVQDTTAVLAAPVSPEEILDVVNTSPATHGTLEDAPNISVSPEKKLLLTDDNGDISDLLSYADGSDNEIFFGPLCASSINNSLDSTIPITQAATSWDIDLPTILPPSRLQSTSVSGGRDRVDKTNNSIRIRRGNALEELKGAFIKNPSLMEEELTIRIVSPDGSEENGEGVGAFRDVLTEFWSSFYERCTLGSEAKVPFIRHDYEEYQWQAVARIFVKGWTAAEYIPLQLALPFLNEVLFSKSCEAGSLLDAFLSYVAKSEKDLLKCAIIDFDSVDKDDLYEILETYHCKRNPTKDSLGDILKQIAHKELVQAPMYVIDCWRPIMQHLGKTLSQEKLCSLVQSRHPTAKNVIKQFIYPERMSTAEQEVSKYLQRYIKEIPQENLQRFLRFCTGADVLVGQYITIYFVEMKEFERRPIGRTCTSMLQLPSNYCNYPDFRAEFNSVLNSSVWTMDFV